MPPNLCVFEGSRSYLDNTSFPCTVFLEQKKSKAIDACIFHCVECVSLFKQLQVFQLCQVLYHVVKLLLVVFRPAELNPFVNEAPKLVCGHGVVRAKFAMYATKLRNDLTPSAVVGGCIWESCCILSGSGPMLGGLSP